MLDFIGTDAAGLASQCGPINVTILDHDECATNNGGCDAAASTCTNIDGLPLYPIGRASDAVLPALVTGDLSGGLGACGSGKGGQVAVEPTALSAKDGDSGSADGHKRPKLCLDSE